MASLSLPQTDRDHGQVLLSPHIDTSGSKTPGHRGPSRRSRPYSESVGSPPLPILDLDEPGVEGGLPGAYQPGGGCQVASLDKTLEPIQFSLGPTRIVWAGKDSLSENEDEVRSPERRGVRKFGGFKSPVGKLWRAIRGRGENAGGKLGFRTLAFTVLFAALFGLFGLKVVSVGHVALLGERGSLKVDRSYVAIKQPVRLVQEVRPTGEQREKDEEGGALGRLPRGRSTAKGVDAGRADVQEAEREGEGKSEGSQAWRKPANEGASTSGDGKMLAGDPEEGAFLGQAGLSNEVVSESGAREGLREGLGVQANFGTVFRAASEQRPSGEEAPGSFSEEQPQIVEPVREAGGAGGDPDQLEREQKLDEVRKGLLKEMAREEDEEAEEEQEAKGTEAGRKEGGEEVRVQAGVQGSTEGREERGEGTPISTSWEDAAEQAMLKVPPRERALWRSPNSAGYHQCIQRSKTHKVPVEGATNGYLMVTANGGLNQMRSAICDMAAVARIMNVTLVVPSLDHTSFWNDTSDFEHIFDVDHFIRKLRDDIHIVKELPRQYQHLTPPEKVPVSWSTALYYRSEVLPLIKKDRVIHFPLTDSRLSNNNISDSIQRVRCRANYRALKHTTPIERVSDTLVKRLQAHGPYIALHLRYEKDMLAFTGCTHGLSPPEVEELRVMRYSNGRWKEKEIDGAARRQQGACPLTPRETALFLRALGFPNSTVIYIAAGEIYGSRGVKDLALLYPKTFSHATLATPLELTSLGPFQNRLAAVDYEVALKSNVFVATYEGNMAKTVQGHRRFEGHRRTIAPDRKKIVHLVDSYENGTIPWSKFRLKIRQAHERRDGRPRLRRPGDNPKSEENFFANSFPSCICESRFAKEQRTEDSKVIHSVP